MPTTLGERLDELREQAFTGRREELDRFRRALRTGGVIFVHGPGGVGKTTLLDAFARLAARAGRTPVRVDARHLVPGPDELPVPGVAGSVVLIDTYELLGPVDDRIREQYLPSLPAGTVVVLAGRDAPGPRWRVDPAWRELLAVVALGNLGPRDGLELLAGQGVPERLRDQLLRLSHGHPLTLSMLAEVARDGVEPRALGDLPDVVGALLAHTVEAAPSPRHRTALEVCAHAAATTEDVLRGVVGGDVGDLFAWLRGLSFVEEGPYGLFPHDVVREALDADLRWRDPDRWAALDRALSAAMLARIRATADVRERRQLVIESIVLAGGRSRIETCGTPPPTMQASIDALRPGDGPRIVDMTARHQGEDQARLVAYWMDREPSAFHVFREPSGEPRGYAACVTLDGSDPGADPGADAMWAHAQQQAPPRPGEQARAWRFFLDRDHGQSTSPSVTLFAACQTLEIFTRSGTAWTFSAAHADESQWGPTMHHLDFWRVPAADYAIGDATYPVFAHDWRRTDPSEWMSLVADRQAGGTTRPTTPDAGDAVLSREQFGAAVRAALHDLDGPDHTALHRSRVVRRAPGSTVRDLVEEAAAGLPPDLGELVERTFLRPTTTQARVAESLHLSFNTYRRHRDDAVDRIVKWLWERETE